jgi:hypothetical protein
MKCLILLSVVFACLLLVSCSLPRHQGPKSDHFDGKTFFNPQKSAHKGFFQLLKWQLFGVKKPWPKWVEFTPSPFTDFLAHREDQIRVTWINHASVLIEHQNLKILTDPVFSQRVSPFSWVGPQRVKVPGVELKNLPKVDVILISHNHYDHLDIESLKKINQRDFPKIFAPLGDCKVISQIKDVECIEVDWSEKKKLNDLVEITFTPSRHWSARGMFDRNKSLWGAFVIQAMEITSKKLSKNLEVLIWPFFPLVPMSLDGL